MSANSPIEWTDHTFNPWWGCSKVSPGCDNCYAERDANRFMPKVTLWGTRAEGSVRRVFDQRPKHWNDPLRWNKKAIAEGRRARVFCASMADVFDNHPGVTDEREALWTLIHKTPALDWQLLTKRVGNVAKMVPRSWMTGHWPAHAWIGASIVNQEEADRDIPKLLALPARVRFLSCEPLLGPIALGRWLLQCCGNLQPGNDHGVLGTEPDHCCGQPEARDDLSWVIAGGESGPHARPAHPDWFRSLRDQCAGADVPFLMKQMGGHPDKRAALDALPEDLRVREFPK